MNEPVNETDSDPTVYRRVGVRRSVWERVRAVEEEHGTTANDLLVWGLERTRPTRPREEVVFDLEKDFVRYPGGRFKVGGPNSGEALRDDFLIPLLGRTRGPITVNLNGALGVPVSFVEEAFGGLVRKLGPDVVKRIKLVDGEAARDAAQFMAEEAARMLLDAQGQPDGTLVGGGKALTAAGREAADSVWAQIQSGELDVKRVQLAAWLGYAPALGAADPAEPARVPSWARDWSQARQALRWGLPLSHSDLVLIACDFAERVPQGERGKASIAAARAWIANPRSENSLAALAAPAAVTSAAPSEVAAAWVAKAVANSLTAGPCASTCAETVVKAKSAWAWAKDAKEKRDAAVQAEEQWQANRIAEVLCYPRTAVATSK